MQLGQLRDCMQCWICSNIPRFFSLRLTLPVLFYFTNGLHFMYYELQPKGFLIFPSDIISDMNEAISCIGSEDCDYSSESSKKLLPDQLLQLLWENKFGKCNPYYIAQISEITSSGDSQLILDFKTTSYRVRWKKLYNALRIQCQYQNEQL